jgi:hypothetical protein
VEVVNGHLERGPAQAAGQRPRPALLIHFAFDGFFGGTKWALEALSQRDPFLGLDLCF